MARQWPTYWLRVFAVGVGLLVFWWFNTVGSRFQEPTGGMIFVGIHKVLLVLVWFVAPLLTADCLAREKREGTLGLLFLTPLKPGQVVLGKVLIHALRSGIFLVAAVPVMVLPVLMGGVAWMDALRLFFLQIAALLLALAAGVLASSWAADWWRTRLLALSMTLSASALFAGLYVGLRLVWRVYNASESWTYGELFVAWVTQLQQWIFRQLGWTPAAVWSWRRTGVGATAVDVWLAVVMMGFCALLTGLAMLWATQLLRRSWANEVAGLPVPAWQRLLIRERFGTRSLRWARTRLLQRNPVSWWFSRHWTVRTLSLSLCAAVIVVLSFTAPGPSALIPTYWIARGLSVGLALFAAGGFYRERTQGVLEVWLVTPIKSGQILCGRAAALLRQWGPAWLAYALIAGYFDYWRYSRVGNFESEFLNPKLIVFSQYTAFLWHGLAVIAVGLYFSLRLRNFPLALVSTVLSTLGVRLAVSEGLQPVWIRWWDSHYFLSLGPKWTVPILGTLATDMLVQGLLGTLAWTRAKRLLEQRGSGVPSWLLH